MRAAVMPQLHRTITSLVVGIGVLLMLFTDCQAMSFDRQALYCCRTELCHSANRAYDCCKHIVSSQAPTVLPSLQVPPSAPPVIAVDWLPLAQLDRNSRIVWPHDVPPQHSPPDLYLLYASLLI